MRNVVRWTVVSNLTGLMLVSVAWAGVGLAPVPPLPTDGLSAPAGLEPEEAITAPAAPAATAVNPVDLGAGELLVGAAKTSMEPQPERMQEQFPDARWETDPARCKTLAPEWMQDVPNAAMNALDGVASAGSAWPENPDCIYMGGFGLGPMNPVKSFDTEFGLWVRSLAVSDGAQTVVLTVIDGEGWLWDYKSKCTDCGAKQINAALGADPELAALGVTPASHVLHATHSHASPDFIGGWGFVPNWYMAQITEDIKATAKQAVLTMEAATLETGEQEARAHNSERRSTYRSAEESSISWLRAVAVNSTSTEAMTQDAAATETTEPGKGKGKKPAPSPSPTETSEPEEPAAPRVIATLGAFAAHPVTYGTNDGVAHADWVGLFNQRLEERFGGIGMHFMTGLGNLTGANRTTGGKLADLVPAIGGGRPVTDTTVKIAQGTVRSALTNVPLSALGTPGLFDRKFDVQPAAVSAGKSSNAPCVSASAQSVELPYTVARIGQDIVLSTAPGEVFANYTNTVKEKNAGRITFPLAQSNDALGYMPQSFEMNPVGQQGAGFAAGGYVFVNYEDSYAIDRCTGDLLLEETLKLLQTVKQ